MKLAPLLLLVAAIAGVAVWAAARPTVVTTVSPSRGDAALIVYATGVVEPRRWAKVTPLVRERIVELSRREGAAVEVGDVLARLDGRQIEATLAELRARLALAVADHERLAVMLRRDVGTPAAVERALSEVVQVEALVTRQTALLEAYVLRSPMRGVVLRQDGEVGEIAELGDELFWIGEPRPLLVEAEVNEEDIPQVAVGQRSLVRADAFLDRRLEAVVDSITPKGDPVAKTYRVRFTLPDDTPLMVGMTVELNVVTRVSANALLLPVSTLDGEAVFVIEPDGVARRRQVRPGIRGALEVEVLSGLSDEARVVMPFPEHLADGAQVRDTRE